MPSLTRPSQFNPSPQITIGTGNVNFGLTFQGQTIGSAVITGLVLVPGANLVPTAVHYAPSGSSQLASGQVLLENFIQVFHTLYLPNRCLFVADMSRGLKGITSDTIIIGSTDTTVGPHHFSHSVIQTLTPFNSQPIASLKEALSTIKLGTSIPPLKGNLVTQANLAFPLNIADTGIADATITLAKYVFPIRDNEALC